MVSIFKTLGEVITKHPYAFVGFWILALIISLPLTSVFTTHLQYDMQKFIPSGLGAFVAKDKYDEQFPGNNSTNQILVVVESGDKATSMHFIDGLDARLKNGSSVRNLTGTSSIYSVQRDAVINMTPDLYHNLNDAMDNVSDGNRKLYNATDDVRNSSNGLYWLWDNVTETNSEFYKARKTLAGSSAQLYSARDQIVQGNGGLYQIRGTFDLIYGSTLTYGQAFGGSFNGSNLDEACTAGYNAAMASCVNPITDPHQKQLASTWVGKLNSTWKSEPTSNPGKIAQDAGTSFMNAAGGSMTSQEHQLFGGLFGIGYKGYSDYRNYAVNHDASGLKQDVITVAMQMQGLSSDADRARLSSLYDLGSSPSPTAIDNMVISMAASQGGVSQSSIAEIYYLGRNPSDAALGNYMVNKAVDTLKSSDAGKNMTPAEMQNATDMIHAAWDLGPSASKQDFDNYVLGKAKKGLNASENQTVDEIWNWGRSPNDTVIRNFVLEQAGKGLNASENQSLAEVYDLGRNASNETISNYIIGKTLDDLNITSNTTYFSVLLSLDRNMTDSRLKDFARNWEASHGYDDPKVLPNSVVDTLASGNVTLYVVTVSDILESKASSDDVLAIRQNVADEVNSGQYPGVRAYVTGESAMSADTETASGSDIDNIDKVTIALVLIILGLYFRSFLTPFVPLVIIGVAVFVSMGFMGVVSTQIDVFYLVMTFMIVIMLGAGTDYCVFMLSRYAEERSRGAEVRDSVKVAVEQAGKSIASSGSTAMIGFGSLTLVDSGIFRSIGIGTAASIFFSMLVALTLVPAVMTIAGDRIFWPRKIYMAGPGVTGGILRRITTGVIKHAKLVLVLALLITVPSVYIFTQLQLGNDIVSMMPGNVESKVGYDILNTQFGSGALDRSMVVATLPELKDASGNYTPESLDQVESIAAMIASTPGVDRVYSITRPEGNTINYDNLSSYNGVEKEYYRSYMDNNTGIDGRTTLLYVSYNGSPYSEQSQQAIEAIRQKEAAYNEAHNDTTLLLGGNNVGTYEYQKLCTDKYSLVIPVVLIGIFLILVLLLRSIFTPARLVLTLLMSISWTLAAFILVFQYWMHVSVSWILPIILFCVLMGLGVDYDIFLVSRIREEVLKGKSDEEAITHAVESTGTIITLCGAVMASAFGSMLLSNMLELKEFGFVLCLAIILDATVVRLIVVPAIMVLMKKYNWWMPFARNDQPPLASIPEIQKPK